MQQKHMVLMQPARLHTAAQLVFLPAHDLPLMLLLLLRGHAKRKCGVLWSATKRACVVHDQGVHCVLMQAPCCCAELKRCLRVAGSASTYPLRGLLASVLRLSALMCSSVSNTSTLPSFHCHRVCRRLSSMPCRLSKTTRSPCWRFSVTAQEQQQRRQCKHCCNLPPNGPSFLHASCSLNFSMACSR